jgi:hypothetical protein
MGNGPDDSARPIEISATASRSAVGSNPVLLTLLHASRSEIAGIFESLSARYAVMVGIIRAEKGILLVAGGIEDHVHLLAKLPRTIGVSDMLRLIKAGSSKWANERPDVRYFEWQAGYAAFSGKVVACQDSGCPADDRFQRRREPEPALRNQANRLGLLRRRLIASIPPDDHRTTMWDGHRFYLRPRGQIRDADDTIRYSDGWTAWRGNGPPNGTLHYADRSGETAQVTIRVTGKKHDESFNTYVQIVGFEIHGTDGERWKE